MKCIYCGCKDSKVIDSRYIDENNQIINQTINTDRQYDSNYHLI